ncbi:MAG: FtsW/RodA/SpoVE family cell cycle protein [Flavobacteriaceae bacterium]|nr:FtsW/RodA/SpoVE family cell cycle protein [Flavobacteriaceae bacterium]
MKQILKSMEGDKAIWGIVFFLGLLSFAPVYSASTNLAYAGSHASGSPFYHAIKHAILLLCGFFIIYGVHKIPYNYFKRISVIALPIMILLLVVTLLQGKQMGGANASRWLRIPFIGFQFQTSIFAGLFLMTFVARYLDKNKDKVYTFKDSFLNLWVWVGAMLIFILPANLSTTAILFFMVTVLAFIGGYPVKYLGAIYGIGITIVVLFMLIALAFPKAMPNRVHTWMSRIEKFFVESEDGKEQYQVEKAKIAIASGGLIGKGPGKSVQKNFLPQSTSDFIFAIITEEYGLLFGVLPVVLSFLFLFFRIVITAKNAETTFGSLLIVGLGIPIIFQAVINMGVAVNLFPVTGQTLPLVSNGGTSIWVTCISIGMILSVTANRKRTEETLVNKGDEEHILDLLYEVEEK